MCVCVCVCIYICIHIKRDRGLHVYIELMYTALEYSSNSVLGIPLTKSLSLQDCRKDRLGLLQFSTVLIMPLKYTLGHVKCSYFRNTKFSFF